MKVFRQRQEARTLYRIVKGIIISSFRKEKNFTLNLNVTLEEKVYYEPTELKQQLRSHEAPSSCL